MLPWPRSSESAADPSRSRTCRCASAAPARSSSASTPPGCVRPTCSGCPAEPATASLPYSDTRAPASSSGWAPEWMPCEPATASCSASTRAARASGAARGIRRTASVSQSATTTPDRMPPAARSPSRRAGWHSPPGRRSPSPAHPTPCGSPMTCRGRSLHLWAAASSPAPARCSTCCVRVLPTHCS